MLRLITISSLICLTLVGSANGEQPIALKLKLKVEGDIERVDTGVWAQCFIEQVVARKGVIATSGRSQLIEQGATFVPTEPDGTIEKTLTVFAPYTMDLSGNGHLPKIECVLARGTFQEEDPNYRVFGEDRFLDDGVLYAPAGPGSCPDFSVKYDGSTGTITDEVLNCG